MADLTVDFSKEKGYYGFDEKKTFEVRTNDFYFFKNNFHDWRIKYTVCALLNQYSGLFEKEFFLNSIKLSENDFEDIKNGIRGASFIEQVNVQRGLHNIGQFILDGTDF